MKCSSTDYLLTDVDDYHDTFAYDLTGNRVRTTRDVGSDGTVDRTTAYAYDVNDRLVTETVHQNGDATIDQTTAYTYDRTQKRFKVSGTKNGNRHTHRQFQLSTQRRQIAVLGPHFAAEAAGRDDLPVGTTVRHKTESVYGDDGDASETRSNISVIYEPGQDPVEDRSDVRVKISGFDDSGRVTTVTLPDIPDIASANDLDGIADLAPSPNPHQCTNTFTTHSVTQSAFEIRCIPRTTGQPEDQKGTFYFFATVNTCGVI